jgi:tryptophan-rich sensory protein
LVGLRVGKEEEKSLPRNKAIALMAFLILCYGVAFVAGVMTRPEIPTWYAALAKPSWRPPNWLFGPVWTILYGLMAVAGWRVWCHERTNKRTLALSLFALQLALNFLWSPVFFNLHRIGMGAVVIFSLAACLVVFILVSWQLDRAAAILFVPYLLWISLASALNYTIWTMNPAQVSRFENLPTAYALFLKEGVNAEGFPAPDSWGKTPAISFQRDWRGVEEDPQRATEVRVLWNSETLFLRFVSRYRELHLFTDARPDGWRNELWERDVAEAFLQPEATDPLRYKELEVSPNGFWIDLNISHGEKEELRSGLRRRVTLDEKGKTWTAELAVPMRKLTESFDPKRAWRANFYRVEGQTEPRFYGAWSPTRTAVPNYHVPAAFGQMVFLESSPVLP